MSAVTVYLVDDEAEIRASIKQFLELSDIDCRDFAEAADLLSQVSRESPAVILSDIRMPKMDGLQLLSHVMAIDSSMPVILITGHGDVQMAVNAMQSGAYDFIEKPFDPEHLVAQITRAIAARKLTLDNRNLRQALADPERLKNVFLGRSAAAEHIRSEILELADSDDHVLIEGEIGTGRSLVARAIYAASAMAKHPLRVINCGALDDESLERDIFDGDAPQAVYKSGTPQTLILEDIVALPKRLQARLCSAIDDEEANETRKVRIIAIRTGSEGELDLELAHRLDSKRLVLPPLRDRGEDILAIFNKYFEHFCQEYGHDDEAVDGAIAARLMTAEWPGNVRQLIKLSEKLAMHADRADYPAIVEEALGVSSGSNLSAHSPLKSQVEAFEEMLIRSALKRHRGSISAVLEELSLPRRTLNEKMARYGLSRSDFT